MRVYKFYTVTTLAVVAALLYIHQHIEIIKLNYILQSNETEVAQLLDQNKSLMYNIEQLESPYFLEARLESQEEAFTMPEEWRIVKLGEPRIEDTKTTSSGAKKGIFDFLIPKALAQVKPAQ